MGLVDYSESDSSGSESEAPKEAQKAALSDSKKSFRKVVDRSNPGKIVVNLPQPAAATSDRNAHAKEPPAKRARTAGSGLFSGFNSFLPAPKNATKPDQAKPAVSLKTSTELGFSRDGSEGGGARRGDVSPSGLESTNPPPPKRQTEPSIPEGQKKADEVKLVGKPLMFKPLSVTRNSSKKKTFASGGGKSNATAAVPANLSAKTSSNATTESQPTTSLVQPPKRVSLFSMHTEAPAESDKSKPGGAYEPLFASDALLDQTHAEQPAPYATEPHHASLPTTAPPSESLDSIARDLNLSSAARRELFGRNRGGVDQEAKTVINFNMDQEYQHNEEVRAAGDQQIHRPVRALHAGKHSLRQLVQNVHSQREALEDSFAAGRANRKEASNKYGWG
ncbi:hypothetical protein RJ55_00081 [Drechmeria coniospora]|nr:hypothetical protein RJ55_00081 [Drechmeria coniospora]